jgi:hypothetical protein
VLVVTKALGYVDVDCVVLNLAQVETNLESSKKQKRLYEMNLCFQNTWAAKLPWAKSMVGVDGKVHQVKCKVYNKIKGCDKLLVPKLNSLWKHVNNRKAITPTTSVATREHYFLKINQHVFNEHLCASISRDSMVQHVARGVMVEFLQNLFNLHLSSNCFFKVGP